MVSLRTSAGNDARRPVVTGLGVVAPNGIGVPAFWSSLRDGITGVGPIRLFDPTGLRHRIAAEVKGFDPRVHLPPGTKAHRMARHTQFALAAFGEALADARVDREALPADCRVCIAVGVSTSAIEICEETIHRVDRGELRKLEPWLVGASQPNGVVATLSAYLQARLAPTTVSTACKAGLDAIAVAADAIREGRADLAVAGGTDAPITYSTCASFDATHMLSSRNDDPVHASRPFDRDRDGGVLGEGAAVAVIESLAHARARGVRPWLEICGAAAVPDPAKTPAGEGLELTMRLALANSALTPEAIDYVCPHGPSDPVIDRVETEKIRRVLGAHAYRIPVSSIKGVTGNPLAAAGPMELVACALAMRHGWVPPTANYRTPDPACDLDYVPQARRSRIGCALVNVHGMGGGNASLVVRMPP